MYIHSVMNGYSSRLLHPKVQDGQNVDFRFYISDFRFQILGFKHCKNMKSENLKSKFWPSSKSFTLGDLSDRIDTDQDV
jgi:hypothetical protein